MVIFACMFAFPCWCFDPAQAKEFEAEKKRNSELEKANAEKDAYLKKILEEIKVTEEFWDLYLLKDLNILTYWTSRGKD